MPRLYEKHKNDLDPVTLIFVRLVIGLGIIAVFMIIRLFVV